MLKEDKKARYPLLYKRGPGGVTLPDYFEVTPLIPLNLRGKVKAIFLPKAILPIYLSHAPIYFK
ncbi:MAG: hypothetical protein C4581_02125 [Nitrospiraceae bacterium]|nr:MAG: hypothetical protein C4581_02125 [Nitrospiraceae bacterium]